LAEAKAAIIGRYSLRKEGLNAHCQKSLHEPPSQIFVLEAAATKDDIVYLLPFDNGHN
jgi:hypothetical protein